MAKTHNKLLKSDLGKLSSFLQKQAKKQPSHPSRLARRSTSEEAMSKPVSLPPPNSVIRAAVAAIPMVGGALDHLLFDGADEIRMKNVESCLAEMSKKIEVMDQASLSIDWFESPEALSTFRLIMDKVQFEPDSRKINAMSQVAVNAGKLQNLNDNKKLSVISHISSLNFVQIRLLQILISVPVQSKEVSSGGLKQTLKGLWFDDIMQAVKTSQYGQFWEGQIQLDLELEILATTNTVNRVTSLVSGSSLIYQVTPLGHLSAKYLDQV